MGSHHERLTWVSPGVAVKVKLPEPQLSRAARPGEPGIPVSTSAPALPERSDAGNRAATGPAAWAGDVAALAAHGASHPTTRGPRTLSRASTAGTSAGQ